MTKMHEGEVLLDSPFNVRELQLYIGRHFILGDADEVLCEGILTGVTEGANNMYLRHRSIDREFIVSRGLIRGKAYNITISSITDTVTMILTNANSL